MAIRMPLILIKWSLTFISRDYMLYSMAKKLPLTGYQIAISDHTGYEWQYLDQLLNTFGIIGGLAMSWGLGKGERINPWQMPCLSLVEIAFLTTNPSRFAALSMPGRPKILHILRRVPFNKRSKSHPRSLFGESKDLPVTGVDVWRNWSPKTGGDPDCIRDGLSNWNWIALFFPDAMLTKTSSTKILTTFGACCWTFYHKSPGP